jgi:hypothetical protein
MTMTRDDYADAAMCLWEYVDNATLLKPEPNQWDEWREAAGSQAMRTACRSIADEVAAAWNLLWEKDSGYPFDGVAFDFEFCPTVMEQGIADYKHLECKFILHPDWLARVTTTLKSTGAIS